MFQGVIDLFNGFGFPGKPQHQMMKDLVVCLTDKTLRQRQSDTGVAFDDIAVVEYDDGRICVDGGDGAHLEKINFLLPYGKFDIAFHVK